MKKTNKMPFINQVYRDVALKSLTESGVPESLIDGVDCSTFEAMEQSLLSVKTCYFSSVHKHIEDNYGAKQKIPEMMPCKTKEQDCNWYEMFKNMDCDPENNKYIANLASIISMELQMTEFSKESKRLSKVEGDFLKTIETWIDKENFKEFMDFLDLQSEIRSQISTESFVCGFRTAYHILNECRA